MPALKLGWVRWHLGSDDVPMFAAAGALFHAGDMVACMLQQDAGHHAWQLKGCGACTLGMASCTACIAAVHSCCAVFSLGSGLSLQCPAQPQLSALLATVLLRVAASRAAAGLFDQFAFACLNFPAAADVSGLMPVRVELL